MRPVFAEISDKMADTTELWIVAICMAALAIGICRWRRWLYWLAFPLTGLWALVTHREFISDTLFHGAIVTELGHAYLMHAMMTGWLPFAALLAYFTYTLAKRRTSKDDKASHGSGDASSLSTRSANSALGGQNVTKAKRPSRAVGMASKLGAGVGFEPTTFRL